MKRDKALDKIVLTGLEFHGYHGFHAEEAKLGARFVVDVEIGVDLAAVGDDLEKTVDYGAIYRLIQKKMTEHRFYLIEALANHLADEVFASCMSIKTLLLRVHKPHAPLAGVFRDLYVEVNRSREA